MAETPAPLVPDVEAVGAFLISVGSDVGRVEVVGAGAWSSCFGFTDRGRDLVVRFGRHRADFEKDRFAARFASPGLPVPRVLEIGEAFGQWFAISDRAFGAPLEEVESSSAVVGAVADLLEALRTIELPPGGCGGWDASGQAGDPSWSAHLMASFESEDERRPRDWRDRLPDDARETFDAGQARLARFDLSPAPRSLIHADLVNRNVHVADGVVTGVFDWGCGRYGDHLYDLAWIEFWNPWNPNLDAALLEDELRSRWRNVDYQPVDEANRRAACLLHIGLDHIAYNATHGSADDVNDVVDRMRALDVV